MTAEDKLALCEKVIARWLEDELQGDTAMVSVTAILYPGLMSEDHVRWEAAGPRSGDGPAAEARARRVAATPPSRYASARSTW